MARKVTITTEKLKDIQEREIFLVLTRNGSLGSTVYKKVSHSRDLVEVTNLTGKLKTFFLDSILVFRLNK